MEALAHKSDRTEISETFSSVRSFSFSEKKSPLLDEEGVNAFLDAINEYKRSLKEKTEKISHVNERLEKLTWFDNLDDESLMLLNDLISAAKDLFSSLIRQYIAVNNKLRLRGIAKEEIRDFKNSIDDLRESYEDLESVFFFLPEMPDFVETSKKLSLV